MLTKDGLRVGTLHGQRAARAIVMSLDVVHRNKHRINRVTV